MRLDGRPGVDELALGVCSPLLLGADDRGAPSSLGDGILHASRLPAHHRRGDGCLVGIVGKPNSEARRSTSGGNPPCRWIQRPSAHRYRPTHGFPALVRIIDSPSTRMTAKPIVAAAASATSVRAGPGSPPARRASRAAAAAGLRKCHRCDLTDRPGRGECRIDSGDRGVQPTAPPPQSGDLRETDRRPSAHHGRPASSRFDGSTAPATWLSAGYGTRTRSNWRGTTALSPSAFRRSASASLATSSPWTTNTVRGARAGRAPNRHPSASACTDSDRAASTTSARTGRTGRAS